MSAPHITSLLEVINAFGGNVFDAEMNGKRQLLIEVRVENAHIVMPCDYRYLDRDVLPNNFALRTFRKSDSLMIQCVMIHYY